MNRAAAVDVPAAVGVARKAAERMAAGRDGGRRVVDQAVACLLMAAALAVTYLVH